MALNNLLASPSFSAWLEGDPLDAGRLLYSESGRPRMAICTIAHLSDAERMFFVALLLNQLLSWMRAQPGTGSLRALLYIDELFGFMPPVGEPPSKKPLLTLLKQARAYGLGVVLATQNPVDLDYKGLSNTGTWFIGRLQTERDRERVLDGLAAGETRERRSELAQILGGLDKRVFLLHNVHEEAPAVFHTRWAMSYLAGPLTRVQIGRLAESRPPAAPARIDRGGPPALDPAIPQVHLPIADRPDSAEAQLLYRPHLWGSARIQFSDKSAGVEHEIEVSHLAAFREGVLTVNWDESRVMDVKIEELRADGKQGAMYEPLPAEAGRPERYAAWKRDFLEHLFHSEKLQLFAHPELKEVSRPGESERDFRIRLSQASREARDGWSETLRDKYAKKREALENKIARAEERLDREQEQARQHKVQTAISLGTTLLGAFLGRKAVSRTTVSRAGTVARQASRGAKEAGDVRRAGEALNELRAELDELEAAFEAEVAANAGPFDPAAAALESRIIRPQKSRISVTTVALAWAPVWQVPSAGPAPV